MSERSAAGRYDGIVSFDIEEWFHAENLARVCPPEGWHKLESRVHIGVGRILELLAKHRTTATFFVLGWVAESRPEIVREIAAAGHELASHGMRHRLIYRMTPDGFREEMRRSKELIEQAIGAAVTAYRAPTFSIVEQKRLLNGETVDSWWALDVLAELGFRYDSSLYPVVHDRYGTPRLPRHPYVLETQAGNRLVELPPSTLKRRMNVGVAGGAYFRFYPLSFTLRAYREIVERDRLPIVFYLHPWELDPKAPRRFSGPVNFVRQYAFTGLVAGKLERLLSCFHLTSLRDFVSASGEPNRIVRV